MARVATYVFLDLETSGLPSEEFNKTKITELSMVAVKRLHLLDTRPGSVPRVQHKLTLCFNPRRQISDEGSKITGLWNDLLVNEPVFDLEVFNMISTFLNVLSKPVCLIAQNGLGFDFPILKNQLEKLKVSFSEELLCADCYHGFYDILEKKKMNEDNIEETKLTDCCVSTQHVSISNDGDNSPKSTNNETVASPSTSKTSVDEVDFYTSNSQMQAVNETTPKKKHVITNVKRPSKASRRMPWGKGPKPKNSYKLKDIYERVLNKPASDAHRAENDCIFALEVSAALSEQFVEWVDENQVKWSEIKPMTIGYVVPWLVNQAGSLVYLLGVQRAPLSLAVPVANGLSFAMVAVKRPHLLDTRPGSVPRVKHKLTLCFNPPKKISDVGSKITGLYNNLLVNEPVFDLDVFNMISTFLNVLSKPVCLIAQNGHQFDFPILKNYLEDLKVSFSEELLCADCYHGFYDILEKNKKIHKDIIENIKLTDCDVSTQHLSMTNDCDNSPKSTNNEIVASPSTSKTSVDEVDFYTSNSQMQAVNETTPKKKHVITNVKRPSKASRRKPWGKGPTPKDSYKLRNIYERVLNRPAIDAHRAENDCIFALEVSAALSKQFVEWVDENQ
ncbi:Three prime repair exonuclease 1, partial [Operophtera brumata]